MKAQCSEMLLKHNNDSQSTSVQCNRHVVTGSDRCAMHTRIFKRPVVDEAPQEQSSIR